MKRVSKVSCLFLKSLIISFLLGATLVSSGQERINSLNADLRFDGNYIIYKGNKIQLGEHAFYIDGQLSEKEAERSPFVFNSFTEAVNHISNGTEDEPMTLYIAPWVYWIDDPDDPEIRLPEEGQSTPFGMELSCEWLKFFGLSDNPYDVILASNRGQTMGAKGNFTMFNIKGDGLCAENITFGNYCNIDLVYSLNPKLNREKRGSAIVQAQLVFSDGDKVVARNTNFISRLNLGPFWGSKRTLFDRCHFESTDDALNGRAVYLDCTFDFHSGKPFWGTSGTGAVFLNCDITSFTRGSQYFTKSGGQLAVVDTRFHSETLSSLGWRDHPSLEARNYQYNIRLNNAPVLLSQQHAYATVDMTNKPVLNAYRFVHDEKVIYNTYNLLRGNDDWDPMGVKELVENAEKEDGQDYADLPTQLIIKPTRDTLETGTDSLTLTATINKFGNYELKEDINVNWSVASDFIELVKLQDKGDGTCLVIPTNESDETREVVVTASTNSGLEAASVLYITPSFLSPPGFIELPQIQNSEKGQLNVNYELDMSYEDQSLVSWYRCTDSNGSNPIEVAVSRFNTPLKTYTLTAGDVGYFIMASVSPKHLRCHPGDPVRTVFQKTIAAADVTQNPKVLIPDLEHLSTAHQPKVIPGFWALDSYAPADTHDFNWEADNSKDPWYYGSGVNGAASDTGFVQATKGARMRYQPAGESFGDMKVRFLAVPAKTAGQGFSSARAQYMDIGLKMDLKKMNGYALRLIRTTKYSDATDFILMKYEDGVAKAISEPVSASCYRPKCLISAEIKGNKLVVHAENTGEYFTAHDGGQVKRVVDMEAEIEPSPYGGFSIQHTGSIGSGATLIKDLKIEWF
jgi:hypothetical protein